MYGNPFSRTSDSTPYDEGLTKAQNVFSFIEDEDANHGIEWPPGSGNQQNCALGVECFPPLYACASDPRSFESHGALSLQTRMSETISSTTSAFLVGSFTASETFSVDT